MAKGSRKSIDWSRVNIREELACTPCKVVEASDNQIKLQCPSPKHVDTEPSASMNLETAEWYCHGCKRSGRDFSQVLAWITGESRNTTRRRLVRKYNLDQKEVSLLRIDVEHEALWKLADSHPYRVALRERGITDEMIRDARIGYSKSEDRLTIPIFDEGRCVNLRLYRPGAKHVKFKGLTGHNSTDLYPHRSQLQNYKRVVIAGGELKALLLQDFCNRAGIGVVSSTAGEGSWHHDWTEYLVDKDVYICFDIDEAGRNAAKRLRQQLGHAPANITRVDIPLDIEQYPTGDVSDWFGQEGGTPEEFLALLGGGEILHYEESHSDETGQETYEFTDLTDALLTAEHTRLLTTRVETTGRLVGYDDQSHLVPRKVTVDCNEDKPYCSECIVAQKSQKTPTVNVLHPQVLAIPRSNTMHRERSVREMCGIPTKCPVPLQMQYLKSIRTMQFRDANEHEVEILVLVGSQIDRPRIGQDYRLQLRIFQSPTDSSVRLVADRIELVPDGLDTSDITADQLDELSAIFSPREWTAEAIDDKLTELYLDFAHNVTFVYDRRSLHFATDLVYHSPLEIREGTQRPKHGRVDALLLGESGQGKSEVTKTLAEWYGLGTRISCKTASRSGVIGGIHKLQSGAQVVSWGAVAMNDRGLVILEEAGSLDAESVQSLTTVRSDGEAKLTKIRTETAPARTRLLWIANPDEDRQMHITSVVEVVGTKQDVRRFDFVMGIAKKPFKHPREKVEHTHTQDKARMLVMWAWTRDPDEVVIEAPVWARIAEVAQSLQERYHGSIPLIGAGDTYWKVARLSAALAARTASYVNTAILVRKCHVDYIERFFRAIYDHEYLGYQEYSAAQFRSEQGSPDEWNRLVANEPYILTWRQRPFITWNDIRMLDEKNVVVLWSTMAIRHSAGNEFILSSAFSNFLRSQKPMASMQTILDDEEM